MYAAGKSALLLTATFAALCGSLCAGFVFLPQMGIKWYPSIWMSLIPFSPMLFSSFTANRLFAKLHRALTGREHVAFSVLLAGPIFLVSALCEAAVVYITYGKDSGVSLLEILLAPLDERYSLTGPTGFSFATTAVFASIAAGLIFIPARLRLLAKHARAG